MKKLLILLLSMICFTTEAKVEQKVVEPSDHKYQLYFSITDIEYGPTGLKENLPIEGMIFNKLNHEDGAEYYLATLKEPLNSKGRKISHIIVGARILGQQIGPNMKDLNVNIAYVIDNSLLNQEDMDFNKGEFVAIGFATDISNITLRSSKN